MADNKLRCSLVYRLESSGGKKPRVITLSKYDHASQYESSGGTADKTALYGGRDTDYAKAVAGVIENDPPGGLAEAGSIGGFKVVQSDQHQVVYGSDKDGICYAVITGLSYQSRVAIQMLEELAKEFSAKFKSVALTAEENSLTRKGKTILSAISTKYEDPTKVDKTLKVLGQVDNVKSTMQDNISSMLKNTEAADSLAEKSDQLNEQASVFKKKSKVLKDNMWWKNMKMTLLLGAVIFIILLLIMIPIIRNVKKMRKG